MSSRRFRVIPAPTAVWSSLILLTLGCPSAIPDGQHEAATRVAPAPEHLSALLINGGGNRQINYHSHLDHLRRLVAMLDVTNVNRARIAVFSADGADPAADLATREGHLPLDFWLLPRSEARRLRPPIEYVNSEIEGFTLQPATRAALRAWFETEGRRLASGDTLLLYVTDHGKQDPKGLGDNTITLWGEQLSVSELRELLTHIGPGVRVVMLMSQCYSGGFANVIFPDGVEIAPTGNVCGYFSAPPDRKAHGCYPEASGKETLGHSHRMFDALPAFQRLPDAQREVLVTDGTPDVPHATTGFFLAKQLERNAALGGHETAEFVDMLLVEAWEDPLTWEREIRLLDRVGQTFGFSSSRSLEQLDDQTQGLSALRDQLDIYAERWERALDALQHENMSDFHAANPELRNRVAASALKTLNANERGWEIDVYLEELADFTEHNPERDARLRDLYWKAEEARAARYRADVRVAAALRIRSLLMGVAGRHYLNRYASDGERATFERLESCEDLTLVGPDAILALDSEAADPFPTLDQERLQIEAIIPGWLGLHYKEPQEAARKRQDLPPGAAFVSAVLPDSPAATAKLEVGDIVLGPPGAPFQERHGLREWVMQSEIGRPLTLRLSRDGREIELAIRLAPYPLELPKLPGPPQIGSAAPPLELDYLPNSRKPGQGQSRLIFFWATWCGPCKQSLPELLAFARDRDMTVVSITDEDPGVVGSFLRKYDGRFPEIVATDPDREQFQKYGVSGTPTFVLVDRDGVVRHYQIGYKIEDGLRIDGWQWTGGAH
jgi:thiol-disulfide isomerase/thioredoxin